MAGGLQSRVGPTHNRCALLLVGSKVLLALAVGRSREFLKGRAYRLIIQMLGVLLAVFALLLLCDGMQRFQ